MKRATSQICKYAKLAQRVLDLGIWHFNTLIKYIISVFNFIEIANHFLNQFFQGG
jgi:hypothetical protein